MDQTRAEELVRRLATPLRVTELYWPTHPVVLRGMDGLAAGATEALQAARTVIGWANTCARWSKPWILSRSPSTR